MIPKGRLIAVGGAEHRDHIEQDKLEVLRRILQEMRGPDTVLEIIPTASGIPKQIAREYTDAFGTLGCKATRIMNIRKQKDAQKKEFLDRLRSCDGIMFSGGNQTLLSETFLGTEFLDILKSRYINEPGFVIAGTSAGAMAQSGSMINGGAPAEALMRGKALMIEGLGFTNNSIIDSHFVNRGRFGRLMVAVAEHPQLTGIGISEDTAVIIKEDRYLEIIGTGLVVIMDGTELRLNNITNNKGEMVNLERMIFHLLSKGRHYDMQERKVISN
ncbi:MAG TPA: cyanophycinase [Chitinophagales bacterium]|nr:cyanophycinase [Chitinophagales bacterium]HMU70349.1 cyanophycinase [Chitinophagales bacterium]HMX03509.1 cyanophycinase [Chitinophagales bacterium]HNE44802.1 cyanophycinase [Chitinophagales bacterium]HNJ89273.1 cyanophycinase [Chitinophagales bacterium]